MPVEKERYTSILEALHCGPGNSNKPNESRDFRRLTVKGSHLTLATTFLFAALLIMTLPVAAQQGSETDKKADGNELDSVFFDVSNINVVNVDVFVTDKQGNPVTGLTKDDFLVYESGDPVEVTNFYAVANGRPTTGGESVAPLDANDIESPRAHLEELLPEEEQLNLIIYLDNKNLHPSTRNRVLNRMHRFLRSELSRGDRVMVVSYDQSINVRQPFTTDMDLVEEALDEISGLSGSATLRDAERRNVMEDIQDAQDGFGALGFARSYADSVYTEMNFTFRGLEKQVSVLSGLTGRKAILYISDGLPRTVGEDIFLFVDELYPRVNARLEAAAFDFTTKYRQLVTKANSSDVTFYTLEATGLGAHQSISAEFGGTEQGGGLAFVDSVRVANLQEPLHILADDTGGESFTNTNAVEMSLGKVAQDFKNYYSLGYRAPHHADGRYYKIEVKTKRKGLKVRHRDGYRDRTSEARLTDGSLATLYFGGERNPLEAALEFGATSTQGSNYVLPLAVKVPLQRIALAPQEDLFLGRIKISLVVMDEEGGTSPVQQQEPITIKIPASEIEEARQQHYVYEVGLALRRGFSRIAVGIHDEISSETSFLRETVNIGGGGN